jgi:hypothetical protein
MLFDFIFSRKNKKSINMMDLSHISKVDQTQMKRTMTRAFSNEDGQRALAYLQYIVFYRQLGADVSNESLRFHEGQRALLSTILRMIEQGREN